MAKTTRMPPALRGELDHFFAGLSSRHELEGAIEAAFAGKAADPIRYTSGQPGEVLGNGEPDWPADLLTFAERRAYQRGVADARRIMAAQQAPDDFSG